MATRYAVRTPPGQFHRKGGPLVMWTGLELDTTYNTTGEVTAFDCGPHGTVALHLLLGAITTAVTLTFRVEFSSDGGTTYVKNFQTNTSGTKVYLEDDLTLAGAVDTDTILLGVFQVPTFDRIRVFAKVNAGTIALTKLTGEGGS